MPFTSYLNPDGPKRKRVLTTANDLDDLLQVYLDDFPDYTADQLPPGDELRIYEHPVRPFTLSLSSRCVGMIRTRAGAPQWFPMMGQWSR